MTNLRRRDAQLYYEPRRPQPTVGADVSHSDEHAGDQPLPGVPAARQMDPEATSPPAAIAPRRTVALQSLRALVRVLLAQPIMASSAALMGSPSGEPSLLRPAESKRAARASPPAPAQTWMASTHIPAFSSLGRRVASPSLEPARVVVGVACTEPYSYPERHAITWGTYHGPEPGGGSRSFPVGIAPPGRPATLFISYCTRRARGV